MEQSTADAGCRLFIVLEQFTISSAKYIRALAPLSEPGARVTPVSTDAYFRADTGVALLAMTLLERPDEEALAWLVDITKAAGVPILDPEKLMHGDRKDFYGEYLSQYEVALDRCDSCHTALMRLCASLSLDVSSRPARGKRQRSSLPPPIPADAQAQAPKGKAANRVLAKVKKTPPPPPGDRREEVASANTEKIPRRQHAGLRPRAKSPPPPSRNAMPRARGTGSDTGSIEISFDHDTETRPDTTPHRAKLRADTAPELTARFLRGDRWIPARVRNLGVRGAHIAASASPRLRDVVVIELSFRDLRVAVTGQVTEQTAEEGEPRGFHVRFSEQEAAASSHLVALLMEARQAGLTLEAPPRREAVRFPIRLPIRVRTGRGEVAAAATDVSAGGLFLATDYELVGEEFSFQIPLDLGGPPIRGRGKVVRAIDADTAADRGLYRGYGVQITDLGERDMARFHEFVERVEKRSGKRVVVAANTGRAEELASCLSAVGYAAALRTNTDAVGELMNEDPNPPDVAVIDSSDEGMQRARLLRSVFEKRQVPCVSAREQQAEETRAAVDRLLSIDR